MRFPLKAALAGLALALPGGALVPSGPAVALETLSGAYLAGRAAAARSDYAEAAAYFARALARDPGDAALRDRAMTFKLLTGDLRGAAAVARGLAEQAPDHQLAALTLAAWDIAQGEFAAAESRLSADGTAINPIASALLKGWAAVGRGDEAAMEAAFGAMGDDGMPGLFASYHLGLARAAMGDLEGAREALEAALDGGARRDGRPALALAAVLEQLGETEAARDLYAGVAAGGMSVGTVAEAELARLDRGEEGALMVRSARAGAAEAMLTIASALGADRNPDAGLLYGRFALALRPELEDARLLVARLLSQQGRHEAAADVYQVVPRRSPLFVAAELGRSEALMALDRVDVAVAALDALAADHPDAIEVRLAQASALRADERWEESAEAYDAVIALLDPVQRRHWSIFYQRGIARERAGDWDEAEADFFKALELEPEQPLVLNYLGYSWVELRKNFDRAQEMIESAVEQRPDDGYITDSLGWVLYRIGKYAEAVPHLERAVELEPGDPIINDHLGDALWMVGRKREAAFQWRRALSFEPEDEDAERIRQKLEAGLDAVLAAERRIEEAEGTPAAAAQVGERNGG